MESTPEWPNLWNSYRLWRKDNDAETEAKADMAPSNPKRFRGQLTSRTRSDKTV